MIVRIARVKVGNRQAPQQHQKPHPTTVGFLRLPRRKTPPDTFRATRNLPQSLTTAVTVLKNTVQILNRYTSSGGPAAFICGPLQCQKSTASSANSIHFRAKTPKNCIASPLHPFSPCLKVPVQDRDFACRILYKYTGLSHTQCQPSLSAPKRYIHRSGGLHSSHGGGGACSKRAIPHCRQSCQEAAGQSAR
jgi:hypothetical protein